MNRVIICFLFLVASASANAQDTDIPSGDSLIVGSGDTLLIESYAKHYDPRKALLYAAVLPGLGQIYNKKYWKLPLVYGGMFATGYAINYYSGLYTEYRGIVFRALEAGIGETGIDQSFMKTNLRGYRVAVDKARRERDYMIIIMGVVYLLQIVDAHVDAHLKEFDLNPRLQVSVEPLIEQNMLTGRQTGASLVIRF